MNETKVICRQRPYRAVSRLEDWVRPPRSLREWIDAAPFNRKKLTFDPSGRRVYSAPWTRREGHRRRRFAHCCETGRMRRQYPRGRENVAKRVLIHAAAFNIGLMMRVAYGLAKPRSLSTAAAAVYALILALVRWLLIACAEARAFAMWVLSCRPTRQSKPVLAAG